MFILNLVGEERRDDREEAVHEFVCLDNVRGNGGDGKELQGEVFDRCFGFAVGEKV